MLLRSPAVEVYHGHVATEKAPASTGPCQDQNRRFEAPKQGLLHPLHADPSKSTAAEQQEHMTLLLHALTPATHPTASPGQTFPATQGKQKGTTLEKYVLAINGIAQVLGTPKL